MKDKLFSKGRKKGSSLLIELVFVLALLGIAATVLIIIFGKGASQPGKLSMCKILSMGEDNQGYCVVNEGQCNGVVNPIGTGCPKDKPVCCFGTPPEGGGAVQGKTGTIELWLTSTGKTSPEKTELKDTRKDNDGDDSDLSVNIGEEWTFQIRATGDVTYCKVFVLGKSISSEGSCDSSKGPEIKYKFAEAVDYDVDLVGYDKKGGEQVASAVADINVKPTGPIVAGP